MVFSVRSFLILVAGLLLTQRPLSATEVSPLVINEVYIHPTVVCGGTVVDVEKYVEIYNRSSAAVDTINWWLCDHPFSHYWRILKVPQDNGPPNSESILLQPGDYLVVRFHGQFPPPNGDYSSQKNNSGSTTHVLRVFIPEPALECFLRSEGNFSIWDQSPPADPDFPSFDVPTAIRDFLSWGPNGIYSGWQRGCIASNPLAALWTPPIENTCAGTVTPIFPAVNTGPLLIFPGFSINYNLHNANDPTDYFLAPATEGERNVMPGDLDDDLDMDIDDYNLFVSCLNQPPDPPNCSRADFDHNLIVDCKDWPGFANNWQQYSSLPLPAPPTSCVTPCTPGDFNDDGQINGDDLQGAIAAFTSTSPPCAADVNSDGVVDCKDIQDLTRAMLEAPPDCKKGDVNYDGFTDGADIAFFITMLMSPMECLSPTELCAADMNSDGFITIDDVDPLVAALLIEFQ